MQQSHSRTWLVIWISCPQLGLTCMNWVPYSPVVYILSGLGNSQARTPHVVSLLLQALQCKETTRSVAVRRRSSAVFLIRGAIYVLRPNIHGRQHLGPFEVAKGRLGHLQQFPGQRRRMLHFLELLGCGGEVPSLDFGTQAEPQRMQGLQGRIVGMIARPRFPVVARGVILTVGVARHPNPRGEQQSRDEECSDHSRTLAAPGVEVKPTLTESAAQAVGKPKSRPYHHSAANKSRAGMRTQTATR